MGKKLRTKRIRHVSIIGLFLFFALLPFEYLLAQYGVGSILRYVGIMAMAFAIVDICLLQNFKIKRKNRITILIYWVLFVFFSLIWAIDKERFYHYASMYINNALMFILISSVEYDETEVEILKKAYVLGATLLLIYMTFFPGAITYSSWQHRLTLASSDGSQILDQNYLSAIMLFPYAIVFFDFIAKKQKIVTKLLSILFCLVTIYYIIATGSRSGLIAVCIISAFILKKEGKKHTFIIVIIILSLIITIPLILEIMPDGIAERYTLQAMTGQTDESDDRLQLWISALSMFVQKFWWIIGYGAGSAEKVIGMTYWKEAPAHNFYVAQLVELGILGAVPFFYNIIDMVNKIKKSKYYDCFCGFLGILIMGIFLDLLTTKFFWVAMLMITVCISSDRSYQVREKEL